MNNNLELIYWTNICNFVKPTGSQKTSEIRYRENFWIKSLKNLDFTRV